MGIFDKDIPTTKALSSDYEVSSIHKNSIDQFIELYHYSHKVPVSRKYAFGLFYKSRLVGVALYGHPCTPAVRHVCGRDYFDIVLELSRLVLVYNNKNEASILVGRSLRLLPKPSIVVSYADTKQEHIGYIYQATNWIYTGSTPPRTDPLSIGRKHARHVECVPKGARQERSVKHRYVFFCASKLNRKTLMKKLAWGVQSYPKRRVVNGLF